MSNVRSLSDHNSREEVSDSPFLFQSYQQSKHPKDENFFDFLKFSFCPTLGICTFIFWISVAQTIYFIVEVSLTGKLGDQFLEPTVKTLVDLGAKYPYLIFKGEVFRWFTAMMLHGHFMHLLTNIISQLIFGSSLEKILGTTKIIILYMGSAVCGNIFSTVISNDIAVGASTGIFGIMAGHLCYFIINWHSLRSLGPMRIQYLIFLSFIIFMNLIVGFSFKGNVDNYGHLGGFISGILLSYILINNISQENSFWKWRVGARIGLILFLIICIIVFFTGKEPPQKL